MTEHIAFNKLNFTASEAYKLLRANLMFTLSEEKDCHVIGITSAIRGEGKTTTAINLAYTFAQTGADVLLIDADMRLPNVAKRLALPGKEGLSNVLAGLCPLEEALCKSKALNGFFVLPAGEIPPNPTELLSSKQMRKMIDELSEKMKYIIIDLPPVTVVSDAATLTDVVDAMLIAVRQDYCNKQALDQCVHQLELVNMKIAGFVMNDVNESAGTYKKCKRNYKYYKRYGKKYGYYKYGYDKYGYSKYGYGYGEASDSKSEAEESNK